MKECRIKSITKYKVEEMFCELKNSVTKIVLSQQLKDRPVAINRTMLCLGFEPGSASR